MDLLNVLIMSIISVAILFLLTKLIGNKQISQMNMFDYINGITIGSIAAEMATSLEDDFLKPLIAMLIYALSAYGISKISNRSLKLRRFFEGKTLILYEDGCLYNLNLKKAKLDTNEFLMLLRNNGYFRLSDLQTVILEPNGKLSVLPKSDKAPATPEDLSIYKPPEQPLVNLIVDGVILTQNLHSSGKNTEWLQNELRSQGIENEQNVTLATLDSAGSLSVYQKIPHREMKDLFE